MKGISLRAKLTLAIVVVTGPVVAGLVWLLYLAVANVVWQDVQAELDESAQIFSNLAEYDAEDGYELEGGEAIAVLMRTGPSQTHVVVETPEGALIDDPWVTEFAAAHPDLDDIASQPDSLGVYGRYPGVIAKVADLVPRTEPQVTAPGPVRIWVVRDTRRVERHLATIARWFWVLGTATVFVSSIVAGFTIRRGLQPLADLGRRLDRVQGPDDAVELPREGLPRELRPVVDKLDDLLGRLRETFERERRFSADVSHELRTPLAVLRTSLDVALQGERETDDYRARLRTLRDNVDQMTRMVSSLLTLSRAQSGALSVDLEPVSLRPLVDRAWQSLEGVARDRGLELDVIVDAEVEADVDRLGMVVTNLLSNAVEYAHPGSKISVRGGPGTTVLEVRNAGGPLTEEALDRAFEPFWRADEARSEAGAHCGIGLPLARSLARAQGLDVELASEGETVVARVVRA